MEFYSCVGIPSMSGTCQYTVRMLGESRGILKVVWMECVLISCILDTKSGQWLDNGGQWFWVLAAVKFVLRIFSGRVHGYSNLSFENDS